MSPVTLDCRSETGTFRHAEHDRDPGEGMSAYRSAPQLRDQPIIITGGGTGGHTYPALTTIQALQSVMRQVGTEPRLLWVGVTSGLEARIARENNVPFKAITTGKLRRSPNAKELWQNFTDVFRIPIGIGQAVWTVWRTKPAVVLSTGGFVSVPIGVAAWLFRRPYVMHEQILTLGLANRILSRFATKILVSHPSSVEHLPPRARSRAVVTGNPIRPQVLAGDRERGQKFFGLDPRLPTIAVVGGALGARQVNDLVAAILPDVLPHAQVVHQCGKTTYAQMQQVEANLPPQLRERYRLVEYLGDELPDVYAAADIMVARAGAGTVAELTALGKACILIPLIPTGGDEQRRTARHLADSGAARMLSGDDATPAALRGEVMALLQDPARRERLERSAREHGRPDAADRVVHELLTAARLD